MQDFKSPSNDFQKQKESCITSNQATVVANLIRKNNETFRTYQSVIHLACH